MSDDYTGENPYEVLGLNQDDKPSDDAIKSAYRKIAMKHHPDHSENTEEDQDIFRKASWAYKLLSDETQKKRYDQYGFIEPSDNELKQGVQSTIRTYLTSMIERGEEIFGMNVTQHLAGLCKAQIMVAKAEILKLKKKENHLKKVAKKFRKKKQLSYDFVTNFFLEELNGIHQSVTTNMSAIRILEETIIVVNSYDFEIDPSMVVVNKIVPDAINPKVKKANLGNIFDHAKRSQ